MKIPIEKNLSLVYLVLQDLDYNSGIGRKILSQLTSFRKKGINASLLRLSETGNTGKPCLIINDQLLSSYHFSHRYLKQIERRFNFDAILQYLASQRPRILYIRYTHFATPALLRFLKKAKNQGIKILMEIPTFPYDGEYTGASVPARAMFALVMLDAYLKYLCLTQVMTWCVPSKFWNTCLTMYP